VVVFIPGTAVYALVFAEFMYKLSLRGFHVIGFDPRGHGRSQGMRGSYTIQELVRDTRAVIAYARRRFGTEIFLAGSSQGGIVAFYTAADEPDLKGAVCHNLAVLDDPNTTSLSRRPALARFLKRLLPLARLFSELQVPVALYLDLSKEKTRLFGNAKAFLDQDLLALRSISLKALASLATTPLPCPVEAVPTPIMILHAEYDNIFPRAYVERIYDRLPWPKRFELVRDRPHLLLTDYPDEILPAIEAWLKKMRGGNRCPGL